MLTGLLVEALQVGLRPPFEALPLRLKLRLAGLQEAFGGLQFRLGAETVIV